MLFLQSSRVCIEPCLDDAFELQMQTEAKTNPKTTNSMMVAGSNMGGTHQDPGVFCKLCCPMCAVYQAQECACSEMLLASCCGCFYTMIFWDPTKKH